MLLIINGVQVSIQDGAVSDIVRQHLLRSVPAMLQPDTIIPAIGQEWTGQGGIYAGMARGRDGKRDYHLIVGPEFDGTKTWDDAVLWAADVVYDGHHDFSLPTRKEQALMFANVSELFRESWYWSGEQHAAGSGGAWGQLFGDGLQGNWGKGYFNRARAVRRLAI